jgi:hypothetical protein
MPNQGQLLGIFISVAHGIHGGLWQWNFGGPSYEKPANLLNDNKYYVQKCGRSGALRSGGLGQIAPLASPFWSALILI